jgi:hypothetical protein
MKNAVRPTCMAAYAAPNARPRDVNALGIDADRMRPANIIARIASLTGVLSGSSQLVNQVVYIHTHHTASISSSVWMPPITEKCSISACDNWVIAKTNTRSKKSSTKLTL